eukprot:scaffold18981_cov65-Phaeocystis_antarctica.AAC.1
MVLSDRGARGKCAGRWRVRHQLGVRQDYLARDGELEPDQPRGSGERPHVPVLWLVLTHQHFQRQHALRR